MTDWLCIDLGGQSWGHAYGPKNIEYGGHSIPPGLPDGRINAIFADQLVRLMNKRKPDMVAIEQPFVDVRRFQPMQWRRWMQLMGILHMVIYRFGLPAAREYSPMTIKKQFTGTGHAEKFMVGMECERRGWAPQNDDVADALAVLSTAANMPRSDELQLILKTAGKN